MYKQRGGASAKKTAPNSAAAKTAFFSMFGANAGRGGRGTPRRATPTGRAKREPRVKKQEVKEEGDNEEEVSLVPVKREKKRTRVELQESDIDELICAGGFRVQYPQGIKLYPSQKRIIFKLLIAAGKANGPGSHVLAESPTGSGKTLALLSAACAWMADYKKKRSESMDACMCPNHGGKTLAALSKQEPMDDSQYDTELSSFLPDDLNSTTYGDHENSMFGGTMEKEFDADFSPTPPRSNSNSNSNHGRPPLITTTIKTALENIDSLVAEKRAQTEKAKADGQAVKCTALPKVRVYYGTRTHKQIAQVVKEFGRLKYSLELKHTILGAREQMCVNPSVRMHGNVTEGCRKLLQGDDAVGCTYRKNVRPMEQDVDRLWNHMRWHAPPAWDIEDLKEDLGSGGSKRGMCPYFASRAMAKNADFVFTPFTYLLDPIIRSMSDVYPDNSIIILDEAHNVEDTCRSSASFIFTEAEMVETVASLKQKEKQVLEHLQSFLDQHASTADNADIGKNKEQLVNLSNAYRNLLAYMNEFVAWFSEQAEPVKKQTAKFDGSKTKTSDYQHIVSSMSGGNAFSGRRKNLLLQPGSDEKAQWEKDYFTACEKTSGGGGQDERQPIFTEMYKISSTAIVCLEKILFFMNYFDTPQKRSAYKLNVTFEPRRANSRFGGDIDWRNGAGPRNSSYVTDDDGWLDSRNPHQHDPMAPGFNVQLSFWCMTPSLAFLDAFSGARSVVLASGTLSPMSTLRTELGLKFEHTVLGEQVVPRENLFIRSVGQGPSGARLRCTFDMMKSEDFVCELGSVVLRVSRIVPGGVLVFLPNYRLLDRLWQHYKNDAHFHKSLSALKVVVREPSSSGELGETMRVFHEAIHAPTCSRTGAVMIGVFRGKVSEGIDFTDDDARAVISVGIPFPNAYDEQVLQKKAYNNSPHMKEKGVPSGDEWYNTQAYRALNQALGRCVRHVNDWGALILLDERFCVKRQSGGSESTQLSKWIRESLYTSGWAELETGLREYVGRMRQSKAGGNVDVKKEMKQEITIG